MSSDLSASEPTWHRVLVTLRNTRRIAGCIEHPCHVFHGLLLQGLRTDRRLTLPPWGWHPADAEPWPDELERDEIYRLAVIFSDAETAARLAGRLADQAPRNFVVESVHPPERRTLSMLQAELPSPDWTADEICLDFTTPLAWEARRGPDRWRLDARRLVRMLHHRAALFLGLPEPPEADPIPELTVRGEMASIVGGHPHASKSSPQTEVALAGLRGPIYLRGDWPALWIPLALGSELQLGSGTPSGQGCYRIRFDRQFFHPELTGQATWHRSLSAFRRREELKGKEPGPATPTEADIPALAAGLARGTLNLAPAILYEVPKKPADPSPDPQDRRLIASLPEREQFIHYGLHRVLQPVFERLLLPESIGSRAGHSREDARPLIEAALGASLTHVIGADIQDFFDHVDWAVLARQLREFLPRPDGAAVDLVEQCVQQPVRDPQGCRLVRRGGLLPGSPLSSLLANFYLHEWDLGMRARGWRFVRAVDDIRIFAASEAAAQQALADATGLLDPLGLRFNPAKVAIQDLRTTPTFRFLGLTFGAEDSGGKEHSAPFRPPAPPAARPAGARHPGPTPARAPRSLEPVARHAFLPALQPAPHRLPQPRR